MLSGKITQSGVTDDFVMIVPIYLDMGKGWAKLGVATILGNTSVDITNLKLARGAEARYGGRNERRAGDEY